MDIIISLFPFYLLAYFYKEKLPLISYLVNSEARLIWERQDTRGIPLFATCQSNELTFYYSSKVSREFSFVLLFYSPHEWPEPQLLYLHPFQLLSLLNRIGQ